MHNMRPVKLKGILVSLDQPTPAPHYASDTDEIDLFELMQTLWQEKILIIAITLLATGAAALYALNAQPQYSVAMTLKPAPLSLYGELVAGMDGSEQQGIALGRSTAEQVLTEFKSNLELQANQARYLNDKSIIALTVNAKTAQQVTLELGLLQPDHADQKLLSYLDSVSAATVTELNSFLVGLGNPATITKEMLFTIDVLPASQASLVKPKKSLIVAVGFVLGGMLGVFAALIRSMIRKRKNNL